MEPFRKIASIILLLFLVAPLYGQNRYNIPGVYYNMDTTNCIYEERINFDTVARLADYAPFLPILMMRQSVPIVVMRDSSVIKTIDSLMAIVSEEYYTLFQSDTSGIFINLAFAEDDNGCQNLEMCINIQFNCEMSELLFPTGWEIIFEWNGGPLSSVVGCFFYKDILCLVRSYHDSTWSPQCHYYETGESIQLNLFRRELGYWIEYSPPTVRKIIPLCK